MTLAAWYFVTFWVAPVQTEPVLTPFATFAQCDEFLWSRVRAWDAYVRRNRRVTRLAEHDWLWAYGEGQGWFGLVAGAIEVKGECVRGSELAPESLKSLSTSP
jgi:hypothetical protein